MGTLAASCIMFIRVVIISSIYSPGILPQIIIPGGVMFVILVGATFYFYQKSKVQVVEETETKEYESPFRIAPALQFAGLILFIKFVAAIGLVYKENMQSWLGDAAEKIYYYGLGLISGLADVDAITQTMASNSAEGKVTLFLAASTILIAVM